MPKPLPFRQVIQNLAKYFADLFGLTNVYDISIRYRNENDPLNPSWVASVEYDNTYLRVYINIYPQLEDAYLQGKYEQVIEAITHEFCHYITDPLNSRLQQYTSPAQEDDLRIINESATQRIARAIIPSIPSSLYLAKVSPRPRKRKKAVGK